MAGLINFRGYEPLNKPESVMGKAIMNMGQNIVTNEMQRMRDERLNQYKVDAENRQAARADARHAESMQWKEKEFNAQAERDKRNQAFQEKQAGWQQQNRQDNLDYKQGLLQQQKDQDAYQKEKDATQYWIDADRASREAMKPNKDIWSANVNIYKDQASLLEKELMVRKDAAMRGEAVLDPATEAEYVKKITALRHKALESIPGNNRKKPENKMPVNDFKKELIESGISEQDASKEIESTYLPKEAIVGKAIEANYPLDKINRYLKREGYPEGITKEQYDAIVNKALKEKENKTETKPLLKQNTNDADSSYIDRTPLGDLKGAWNWINEIIDERREERVRLYGGQ